MTTITISPLDGRMMPPNDEAYRLAMEAKRMGDEEDRQSKKAFTEAIIKYVDAKVEHELASFGYDDEMELYGRYTNPNREEEKAMEDAKEELMRS